MAIPLQPTFGDIRNAVAIRSNLARSGNLASNIKPLIDEFIRKGQRYIYIQFPWVRLDTRITMPLVAGQAVYDIPDEYHEGTIRTLGVISKDEAGDATTLPREWRLQYDGMLDVRNLQRVPGRPQNWRIIDQAITLSPVPDDAWATLVIEGQLREATLANDADRVSVDGESLIEYATILLREHMDLGDTKMARIEWSASVTRMRGLYKPVQAYPIASARSDGPAYWDRPSTPMGYVPYTNDWSPW
jgi:hypothetical protein